MYEEKILLFLLISLSHEQLTFIMLAKRKNILLKLLLLNFMSSYQKLKS